MGMVLPPEWQHFSHGFLLCFCGLHLSLVCRSVPDHTSDYVHKKRCQQEGNSSGEHLYIRQGSLMYQIDCFLQHSFYSLSIFLSFFSFYLCVLCILITLWVLFLIYVPSWWKSCLIASSCELKNKVAMSL